jgi:iron complex transport system ATP-binding protein
LAISVPAAGSISIDGRDVRNLRRKRLARLIAYVPQSSTTVFPFSVFDMVLMGRTAHLTGLSSASAKDNKSATDALEQLGIARLRNRSFNEISGGERQLVLIARALCQQAQVLVLDEPTASLDYGNQIRILGIVNELRRSGYAIIMSTHNPDHALLSATHVAILKKGRIVLFGSPDNVITCPNLTDLYTTRIRVLKAAFPEEPGKEFKVCVPMM